MARKDMGWYGILALAPIPGYGMGSRYEIPYHQREVWDLSGISQRYGISVGLFCGMGYLWDIPVADKILLNSSHHSSHYFQYLQLISSIILSATGISHKYPILQSDPTDIPYRWDIPLDPGPIPIERYGMRGLLIPYHTLIPYPPTGISHKISHIFPTRNYQQSSEVYLESQRLLLRKTTPFFSIPITLSLRN